MALLHRFQPQHVGRTSPHCHHFSGSSSWCVGGNLVITACLSLAHYMALGFFLLFVALLTRKTHLKRNTGLLLKKDSNKGKPQSVTEKGYLELWELSTYQRHVAKLLF